MSDPSKDDDERMEIEEDDIPMLADGYDPDDSSSDRSATPVADRSAETVTHSAYTSWVPVIPDPIPLSGVSFQTYLVDSSRLSEEDAVQGLEWLEQCWQVKRRQAARTAFSLMEWEMSIFGVDWRTRPTLLPEEAVERHRAWERKVHVVKEAMSSLEQLDPELAEIGDADVFERCRELQSIMFHTLLHVAHMACVTQPEPHLTPFDGRAENLDAVLRYQKPPEKMKPNQLALYRILGYIRINNYRHIGDIVVEQRYTDPDPETQARYPTHTWIPVMKIDDMMSMFLSPMLDPTVADLLTANMSLSDKIRNLLIKWTGLEFPEVKKDRHVFSFWNGIYNAMERKFYPHDGLETVPSNVVAAKYFPMHFPAQYASREFLRNGGWRKIPLPKYMSILTYHYGHLPPYPGPVDVYDEALNDNQRVILTHFFFQGKLMYWIREMDNFQVCQFIKGFPGTGKSTLCAIALQMYESEDVSDIANRGEQVFGMAAYCKSFLAANTDVRRDFNIDPAFLQKAISGERVRIPIKNVNGGENMMWKTQLLFAGNMFPKFDGECARALSRRLIVFQLDRPINNETDNPNLQDEIYCEEMASFILASNEAYRQWLDGEYIPGFAQNPHAKRQRVHRYLAKPFFDQSNYINQQMNHLEKFIADSNKLEFSPDGRVLLSELASAMTIYIKSLGEREVNVSFRDRDVFLPILRQNRLDYRKERAMHPVTRLYHDAEWITGCFLVE